MHDEGPGSGPVDAAGGAARRPRVADLTQRTWRVVGEASSAHFDVRDKLVQVVHGSIPVTSGWAELGPDGAVAEARVELDASRIDTANGRRDRDLLKPRLLDAAARPRVVVTGRSTRTGEEGWELRATLSARSATVPLTLSAGLEGGDDVEARVVVTGRLDRTPLRMRVPRFVIGRYLDLEVRLTLVPDATPGGAAH